MYVDTFCYKNTRIYILCMSITILNQHARCLWYQTLFPFYNISVNWTLIIFIFWENLSFTYNSTYNSFLQSIYQTHNMFILHQKRENSIWKSMYIFYLCSKSNIYIYILLKWVNKINVNSAQTYAVNVNINKIEIRFCPVHVFPQISFEMTIKAYHGR